MLSFAAWLSKAGSVVQRPINKRRSLKKNRRTQSYARENLPPPKAKPSQPLQLCKRKAIIPHWFPASPYVLWHRDFYGLQHSDLFINRDWKQVCYPTSFPGSLFPSGNKVAWTELNNALRMFVRHSWSVSTGIISYPDLLNLRREHLVKSILMA